jgi:Ca2+-binding RTX toxin-like protein
VASLRRCVVFVLVAGNAAVTTSTAIASTATVQPSSQDPVRDAVVYIAEPGETNDVTMTEASGPSGLQIVDSGATITAGAGCTSIAPDTVTCSFDDRYVEVRLGDGNDTASLADTVLWNALLMGGAGNDEITAAGGEPSFARLFGGPGNDVLRGGDGSDVIDGGAGADLMSGGTSGSCGTAGVCTADTDTVTYWNRTNDVFVDADGVANDGEALEGDLVRPNFERVIGGSGDDTLAGHPTFGSLEGNRFLAGTTVRGHGGADTLYGTRASDELVGGAGSDTLHGGPRGDRLFGSRGDDLIRGGRGRDLLSGADGADRLFARDGQRDRVRGGGGLDTARIDPLDRLRAVETVLL